MFPRSLSIAMLLSLNFALAGCGSSSGSDAGVELRVVAPADDSRFQAGGVINYQLEVRNFTLAPPFNLRQAVPRHETADPHPHDEHGMPLESADDLHGESDDHSHGSTETNPTAREGHYHIYLNDRSGTDEHMTAWSYSGQFQLPNNLSQGSHSLRFELRDNNHVLVGTAGSEAILFFEIE